MFEESDDRKRGRPQRLTKGLIVRAAARFRQEDLSLGKLADELAVTAQSLYHYFPNKLSIDLAVAELVAESVSVPDSSQGWREYVRETCLEYRGFLQNHDYPGLRSSRTEAPSAIRVAGQRSEAVLRRFDAFMGVLVDGGFTPGQAVESWIVLQNFLRRSDLHRADQTSMDRLWAEIQEDVSGAEPGELPNAAALLGSDCPSMDELYAATVDCLIEGLSAHYGVN